MGRQGRGGNIGSAIDTKGILKSHMETYYEKLLKVYIHRRNDLLTRLPFFQKKKKTPTVKSELYLLVSLAKEVP